MEKDPPLIPPFETIRLTSLPRLYRCEPGWRWSPPPLPDYDLWYVLDGVGALTLESRIFSLTAGSSFLLPPGSRPNGAQDPARRLFVFAVHFELLDARGAPLPPSAGRRDRP